MFWEASLTQEINGMNIAEGGTAIRYRPTKVDKLDKPLLVIGLGGTGLRIGRSIKDMFLERFKPAQNPLLNLYERLPAYTRFLAIDTDEHDLDNLGYTGDERCSIGTPNLAALLHPANRILLPSYISDWLNPTIESTASGVAGAQGVRQIGRFALFTNVEKVISSIQTALAQICAGKGRIQVVIVTSVSGGTGAGTFLDMPYLIRHAAKRVALDSRVSIMGIVVTPELHANLDPCSADVRRANGYASLKELDYWMNDARSESFVQQYSPNIAVEWKYRPFDDCILLGSQNTGGEGAAYRKTYDTLLGAVAEYITSLFTYEKRDELTAAKPFMDYGFSYFRYLDNVKNNRCTKGKDYPVFREYTAIGICKGQLPLQDLFLAENVFLFDKVEEYYSEQHTPDMFDADVYSQFVSDIVGNRVNTLLGYIHNPEPRESTIEQIRNSANIAPHSIAIDAIVTAYHLSLESRARSLDADRLIDACVHQLQQELVDMFTDTTKGPFYTCRFIDSTPGEYIPNEGDFNTCMPHEFNLKSVLESRRAAALVARDHAKADHNHQVSLAQNYYEEIKTRIFIPRQNGSLAANYYAACDSANQKIRRYWFYDTTIRLYDALIAKVNELSTQVFKPLCKTLLELTKVYRAIGIYMNTPHFVHSRPSYCRDIVDLNVMVDHFKNTYMTHNKITEMLESLYGDMMLPYTFDAVNTVEPEDRWLSTDPISLTTTNVNVRDNLERITNEIFRDFNKRSLLEFWMIEHPNAVDPNGIFDFTQIIQEFAPEMTAAASPMFLPSDIRPLNDSNTLTSEYITVPNTATGLSGALQTPYSIRHIKESALTDHIFWLRSLDGVCLYHYGDLDACERAYYDLSIRGCYHGFHLWENKKNWRNLPNPVPRGARPFWYNNPAQEAWDADMIQRIDALMDAGSITVDQLTNKLYLTFNTQLTREKAAALMDEIIAGSLTTEEAKQRYEEMLATRKRKQMQIEASFLCRYEVKYEGQDPLKQVVYDMLMQYPDYIYAMEKDTENFKALNDQYSFFMTVWSNMLGMAERLADMFAHGILKLPDTHGSLMDPVESHIDYTPNYSTVPQTVYAASTDNAKYSSLFPFEIASEACVAAKLLDMQDTDHPEHDMLVQLKRAEEAFRQAIESADPDLYAPYVKAFAQNAQALNAHWLEAQRFIEKASAEDLEIPGNNRRLCLAFLSKMIEQLGKRACNYGLMLE